MINRILAICSAVSTFIGVIAIFLCGKIKAENKRLEENLEDKQSELETINETCAIIFFLISVKNIN